MRSKFIVLIGLLLICLGFLMSKESEGPALNNIFVKATIYPTFSLSRYDYNNDINKVELRVYVELKEGSSEGATVMNADVFVNGYLIPYDSKEDDYRKRVEIAKKKMKQKVFIKIKTKDGKEINEDFGFPGWVIMNSPQPDIYESEKNITIEWKHSNFKFPVNVRAYDFKKGTELNFEKNIGPGNILIESKNIPENTILRILVTSCCFFKQYIRDEDAVKGSEINVLPWSQVFVRTN